MLGGWADFESEPCPELVPSSCMLQCGMRPYDDNCDMTDSGLYEVALLNDDYIFW